MNYMFVVGLKISNLHTERADNIFTIMTVLVCILRIIISMFNTTNFKCCKYCTLYICDEFSLTYTKNVYKMLF